jgi:hypothetical protein
MDFQQDAASGILLVRWNDNSVGTVGPIHFGINPISQAPRWFKKEKKKAESSARSQQYCCVQQKIWAAQTGLREHWLLSTHDSN